MLKYISRSAVSIFTALCLFVGSCDLPLGVIPAAHAQTQSLVRYDNVIRTAVGQSVAGAQIWVLNQPTTSLGMVPSPQAQIFGSATSTTPLTQPISSDGQGHLFFYAQSGTYTILIRSPYTGQTVIPDQSLPCVAAGAGCVPANIQVNGVSVPGTPNFTNSSSITFSNPFSGTVQAQAIPPSVNGVPIVGTPNFVNGANSTATSPAAGQIAINVPNPLLIQHNGTAVPDQAALNFNDTTPAPPSGQQSVTFLNDSIGDLAAFVPPASAGFSPQVVVPVVPGTQTILINATSVHVVPVSGVNTASGSLTSAQFVSPACNASNPPCGDVPNASVTWSNFVLPAGITQSNLVNVQVYVQASQTSVNGPAGIASQGSAGCAVQPSGSPSANFGSLASGNSFPLTSVVTNFGSGVTAADIPQITCFAANSIFEFGGPATSNIFNIGLLVTYTGNPIANPNTISIAPPLTYNTASQILGFTPNYTYGGTSSGSSDAYAVSIPALVMSLESPNLPPLPGQEVLFTPNFSNATTSPSLNLNGSGAVTITRAPGHSAIAPGDLNGNVADVIFDGSDWELQNPQTGSAASSVPFSGVTPGTTTAGAYLIGSGASLGTTGTGTIGATAIDGVTVTGTPSAGQVPTSTSSTAADWATPSFSGLSGSASSAQTPTACQLTGCTLSGNVTVDISGTASSNPIEMLQPNLATGNTASLLIGTAATGLNSLAVSFNNVGGTGSDSNTASIEVVGGSPLTLTHTGALAVTDTITVTSANTGMVINTTSTGGATDLTMTNSGTVSTNLVLAQEPGLPTGDFNNIVVGLGNSANNGTQLQFINSGGPGAASNAAGLGLVGGSSITVSSGGGLTAPGGVSGAAPISAITLGPTTVVGEGAAVSCTTNQVCDEFSGNITLDTGTGVDSSPINSPVITITFPVVRNHAPNCVITVFNESNAVTVNNIVATTTTSTLTYLMPTPGPIASNVTYQLIYVCGGI
jgi:hypothetical protein